jgi:hypothetical protein
VAYDSSRTVLIRGLTTRPLFLRNGPNDQLASAAPQQWPFSLRDGSSDEFLNLGTRQRRHGLDSDKTVLAAAAVEQLMRIGELGSQVANESGGFGSKPFGSALARFSRVRPLRMRWRSSVEGRA